MVTIVKKICIEQELFSLSLRRSFILWVAAFFLLIPPLHAAINFEPFVKRLYTNIFEREADTGGLAYWQDEFENGKSATEITKYFFESEEFAALNLTDEQFLQRAYLTLLNREPDSGAYTYWLDQMQNKGVLRDQIFYGFALSPKFKNLSESYGIRSYDKEDQLTAFINRFYNLILQRESDPQGMEKWTNDLSTKTKTPDDIAKSFFFSDEFLAKNVSDEEFIKIAYRTLLNREADEAGLTYWVGQLKSKDTAIREKVLDGFLASNEFQNICDEFLSDEEEQPLQKPNSPTNLVESNVTKNSVTLTWKDNADNELGYKIYRETKNRAFTPIVALGADETTFTDTGLESNRRYSYQVRSFNAQGESAQTATTSTVTMAQSPTELALTADGCAKVTLTWRANSIYDEFNIYRNGVLIAQTDPGVQQFIDLLYSGNHAVADPCHQTFTYSVRAKNSAGVENGSDAGVASGSITMVPKPDNTDTTPPNFTSADTASVPENQTAVMTVTATDASTPIAYSITGGVDAGSFSIDGSTGVLTFNSAPDYENPTDSDTDNIYIVYITATDSKGNGAAQEITVTVTDVGECKVLKTGQTTSHYANDDGDYQKGETRSYSRANDIVTDNVTGLQWQDDAAAKTTQKQWVTTANYNAGNYDDTSGDTAATYCEDLTLGGFTDWRLPTETELLTITDKGRVYPAIDPTFQNIGSSFCWSSTTDAGSARNAWGVNFYFGFDYWDPKPITSHVRCVRAGQ